MSPKTIRQPTPVSPADFNGALAQILRCIPSGGEKMHTGEPGPGQKRNEWDLHQDFSIELGSEVFLKKVLRARQMELSER